MPSSAEPVHPTDGPPGPPGTHGTVIRFDRRTARSGRGRRTPQPAPSEPAAALTPQEELAITLEGVFQHHQRTLSDEATADAYRITLDTVLLMLEGSRAEHLVGEEEYRHLAGMIHGMQGAPEAL
ncbi:hypothetical protein [Streptomyces sp. BE133]|uniref:hypothetical protein n=1 Tax=Streptomyces sp. BE133 TaxID=3002523 RepID=UPI002E75D793|nr:hypothetical protein [Streptomyces sp. BE133]MEE1812668.1 hypothetical protein [Streptomyces sp. BE133]